MKRSEFNRPEIFLLAISLLVLIAYFARVGRNPSGFFIDEASIAYNAHTIAQQGTDEHGQHFPLYFRAFGEYKSPVYIYALAALFRISGPSVFVARLLSAILGLSAAILLGLLAAQMTNRRATGLIVFIAAGLTPWLFEISRLVFEVTLLPVLLSLFLLILYGASKRDEWSWQIAAGLGVLLGLIDRCFQRGKIFSSILEQGDVIVAQKLNHAELMLRDGRLTHETWWLRVRRDRRCGTRGVRGVHVLFGLSIHGSKFDLSAAWAWTKDNSWPKRHVVVQTLR